MKCLTSDRLAFSKTMFLVTVAILLVTIIYFKIIKSLGYWKKRNVPHLKPSAIVSSLFDLIFQKKSVVDMIKDVNNQFPTARYIGTYNVLKPALLIKDPELIKHIGVKDFDYFMNHASNLSEEVDPILTKNLMALHGQKWRDMRSTLSPSFTGSKMKFMFNLMSDCSEQMTSYFQKQGPDVIEVEMKDVFCRFTNDVIATTAFGFTINSLEKKDNAFFLMGKDFITPSSNKTLRVLGYSLFPALMKISVFPNTFTDFFRSVIKSSIKQRIIKGIVRPDMIHLLLEARKGKSCGEEENTDLGVSQFAVVEEEGHKSEEHQKCKISDDDILGQALLFFLAGFDTASSLMSFLSYELAVNPDVQEKLRLEIDETFQRCNEKITYQDLLSMKYLDMVVSETLRKWPPGIIIERMCAKDYVMQSPGDGEIIIEKGTSVFIPVVAIHHDPKYFPQPDKFDPERFNEENKAKISPYTYMPFGIGPRNCIASRYALMETKIIFFHLLQKFELLPIKKTPIPLILSKKQFILAPDEGFWLGIKCRN